jgi:pyruvoyl-dependent arginine decarboxylase (PvlArgDC)
MTQNKTNVAVETAPVVVKKQLRSIAGLFKEFATSDKKTFKNREAIADKIMATFQKLEQTHNVAGREITKQKVVDQIGRIVNAIKHDTDISDWATFNVVEDETQFKLVKREVVAREVVAQA